MAIVAAGIVTGYDWQTDKRFAVRLDIYSHTTENSASGVLTSQNFSVEDAEGLVNTGVHVFLRNYILTEWGITLASGDTIEIINPYKKASGAIALSSKYTAFWELDEADGTRFDSIGSNHLTEVGTVPQAAPGKIGEGVRFDGSYLTIEDSADLASGPDFTLSFWVKPNQPGIDCPVLSSRNSTLDRPVFELWRLANGLLEIRAHNGTTLDTYPTTFYLDPADTGGQWDFVMLSYYAAPIGLFVVRVNELPVQSFSHVLLTDSNKFSMGGDGAVSPAYFSGAMDAVGYAPSILTDPELVTLFNYGDGQEWPFGEVSFSIEQAQNVQHCRPATDHDVSVTDKSDVPGMTFSLDGPAVYSIEFTLFTTSNDPAVAPQFALTIGGPFFSEVFVLEGPASTSTVQWMKGVEGVDGFPVTFDLTVSQGNVPGVVRISGTLVTGDDSGSKIPFQLQHGSSTASLTTVLAGSWGMCAKH